MAGAAVEFLLDKLTELLIHHFDLFKGAKSELECLERDFRHLRSFIKVQARRPEKDKALVDIDREIKEAVYELEDAIDAYFTQQAEVRSSKNYFVRAITGHDRQPRAVMSLSKRLVKPILYKVEAYRANFTIRNDDAPSTSEGEQWTLNREKLIRQDKVVVGLEDEEETIIGYLMEGKDELDVICVTGRSGLGKTTLARQIYENERIAYEFPIRIWIHVSQKFNKRDMLINILKRFTSQDISGMSDDELSQTVGVCLNDKKFLLVLDDVCNVDDWEAIQNILPKTNGRGKVLITSSENIVDSGYRKPHEKLFLTPEKSWKLLQLHVFGSLTDCPPELESIGQLIASQCNGLPLQVVTLSGVLVDQFMKSQDRGAIIREWQNVSDKKDLFCHSEKSLSDVLHLTYSGLPDELRDCYLYMGVFPEGYEIPTRTLACLWIAEGFIQPTEGMSLEEIADQYLYGLISRKLVIATKINARGEVKTCRVHDMIREFCINKAEEQKLFRVIKVGRNGVLDPQASELQSWRRLCVDSNVSEVLSQLPKSQAVRSFLCFHEISTVVDPSTTLAISSAFELLKVLESKSLRFGRRFPLRITRLIHLRYITLSVDHLQSLPESLSRLWNLQTVVVHAMSHLMITIKASIWRLMRLRHLKTNAAFVLDPKDTGGAGHENLQTLNRLSPESCTEDMCRRAHNLRTLGIQGKLAALFKNLPGLYLCRLEKLKLLNVLPDEPASENLLSKLPHHSFFPQNLKSLTLSNTFFHWEDMPTLANMSSLEVLKLKSNAFTGIYWSAEDEGFHNLRFLLISDADLVQWEASDSSFPRLTCLVLNNCRNLNVIPLELANTLERLDIEGVRKSAVESAMRVAEAKKQEQEDEKGTQWRFPFKLSIGPGC